MEQYTMKAIPFVFLINRALIETSDYTPWGLEMKMLGSKAFGRVENRRMFKGKETQSKEFSDGTGIEWVDFGARLYDVQIARWHVIDPLAGMYEAVSAYTFVKNNPINNIEIDGRFFDGQNERTAARLEKWADKRAAKLEKKADRHDRKGKVATDLRARAAELRQSANDVRDMRNSATEFKFVNAKDVSNTIRDGLGRGLPVTTRTGPNTQSQCSGMIRRTIKK
jgi:RHS repeat-associated protein